MRTSSRQRPRAAALAIVLIIAGLGGLVVGAGPASADVDSVQGSAFGLSVDDNLLGLLNIPPTPSVTLNANESSPAAALGPFVDNLLNIGQPPLLNLLTASALDVSTQAADIVGENHLGFVTSFSRLANVTVGANVLNPLIAINAVEIQCVADGNGARVTRLTGLVRVQIGLDVRVIDLSTVAPNTVVDVLGVVRLTLNRQDVVAQPTSAAIRARALEVEVLPAAGIPGITTALDVIVGEVFCAAQGPDVLVSTTVPTTAPPTTVSPTTAPPTTVSPTTVAGGNNNNNSNNNNNNNDNNNSNTNTNTNNNSNSGINININTPPAQVLFLDEHQRHFQTAAVPHQPSVLAKTGSALQPLAVLSVLSLALGILLLVGSSGRPVMAGADGAGYANRPEKWGPLEIGRALWGAMAAVLLSVAKVFIRRR